MRILFFLALSLPALSTLAQTNAALSRQLSLENCIAIALQHNLDIQIKRYDPEVSRFTLMATYGAYDPAFSSSFTHDYSRQPGGIDAQGRPFGGTETESDHFRSGLQGALPWGMSYTLGLDLTDRYGIRPTLGSRVTGVETVTNIFFDVANSNTVTFLSTRPILEPVSFREHFETTDSSASLVQLRQPFLKNFLIDDTRLQIYVNQKQLRISEQDLRFQIMNTVTSVERAYYLLVASQDNVRVQRKALELAERLLTENRKRVEVGALAPLDERQSASQVAQSQADLINALGTEDTQQRDLKKLLSDDYSEWKDVRIQPTESLVAVPERFDLQESWRLGLSQRPDLVQGRLRLEQQLYRLRYDKNQLLPALDLVGSGGWNGGNTPEYSGALDQIANRDNPFWAVGGQLTIPLNRTREKSNYRSAKATREQLELTLKQLEQSALIEIENAIATANTDFQQVKARREATKYAEEALEAEQKKLESGKSTSFIVLQLQKNLTQARSDELRALAEYNIALANIALSEGRTLERRKVTLEVK